MSDSLEETIKRYGDDVLLPEPFPRSIGLFTIPEYPEYLPQRGMWSAALDVILTTLRYLAPATLLTLFWGQQSFFFKLLKHIDSAFRAIVFSSEEQKRSVIQWLSETGPVRVENLDTVWRHGWIVCAILDGALPGACAGHPPTRISLKHAQSIADHYLGVEPVFSRQELDSNDSISKHEEWRLATYLDRIRQALDKITPPVSKPGSQRTSPDAAQFTIDYVARGSGLSAAQVNNKMYFKIYPTAQQSLDPGEITILIRGPKDTYGMTVLPPVLGKAQLIRQKLLGLQTKTNYTENALPLTQGARYLRSYGKNDMNKTYYIPKTKYDIDIEDEMRSDHVKISYIAPIEGRYEIFITSRGQNIVGSPFSVIASYNVISILEKENYCLEDGEEIDIVDVKTDRKVVLRIVDFVTEKMLLRENGCLEKITDDEAKMLMTTDTTDNRIIHATTTIKRKEVTMIKPTEVEKIRFRKAINQVIITSRICKIFKELIKEKQKKETRTDATIFRSRSQQDIPDIVNSTLSDTNLKPYDVTECQNKFIIPENISVSILTDKRKAMVQKETDEIIIKSMAKHNQLDDTWSQDSLEDYKNEDLDNNMLLNVKLSPSNPFINDDYEQNYRTEKDLGSFVTSEYETNNSQNEETRDSTIKIIIEDNDSPPASNNPFIDVNPLELERPKSPVYKIISGELRGRVDSPFVDPKTNALDEEVLRNEFINPFFIHQHYQTTEAHETPTTDFIIGAPVSLPPIIRPSSPVPEIESLIVMTSENEKLQNQTHEDSGSVFSTPMHTNLNKRKENLRNENNSSVASTYHSLDAIQVEVNDNVNNLRNNDHLEKYQIEVLPKGQNTTPNKDIWDSAYVSIDDNNSSPDSNNNDNQPSSEILSKQRFSPSDDKYDMRDDIRNMGPAEREIWRNCSELKDKIQDNFEELRLFRTETKQPLFTSIIEENDRSLSSAVEDPTKSETFTKQKESDLITVAFAELNNIYQEYFPILGNHCTNNTSENQISDSRMNNSTVSDNTCVDSASGIKADVKRQFDKIEGKISEVQENVTESNSASQILQKNQIEIYNDKDETQFGDKKHTNIVLERKKYWDERIRQIEAKSEEATTLQKKRRLSSKHLRNNDSLTRRRGKQIVKNFLNAEKSNEQASKSFNINDSGNIPQVIHKSQDIIEYPRAEVKLVDKWKKYWDNKLETENSENDTISCFRTKSPKNKLVTTFHPKNSYIEDMTDTGTENGENINESIPVKNELPEEVFKAFETSPKRFFGTSRKQILNKIDTFLGKPSTVDKSSTDVIGASHDSGLVSSRISLFHKISNTEETSWSRRKCQSMHNIFQRRDSDRTNKSLENNQKINPQNVHIKHEEPATRDINEISHNIELTKIESNKATLRDKRALMFQHTMHKSFDETAIHEELDDLRKENTNVKKAIKDINKHSQHIEKYKTPNELRKTTMSKSEMDIFNKTIQKTSDDDLDKYKSCDELPKINVKNFISLYETVSKTSNQTTSVGKLSGLGLGSQKQLQNISSPSGAINNSRPPSITHQYSKSRTYTSSESFSVDSTDTRTTNSLEIEIAGVQDKETSYISLSDIELEIVESNPEKSIELSTKYHNENDPESVKKDYKSRFKMAKEYFQSLEELREVKKPPKLNECQLLLQNKSCESLESLPKKRIKKRVKSHSMPSSEIAKIWNQMQDGQQNNCNKLVKISEKFNVDDLFADVMEGKLSRQGSLRGIPHKKAVLETFRSMENISDRAISPYDMAMVQFTDDAKEKQVKSAQTYLNEYPYLPTTDPSKFHSRIDTKASGLISLKELMNKKPRRNSVPDLRLNTSFTANL